MLISFEEIVRFWKVQPKSILHVGAHEGEEADQYLQCGIEKVTWIEAQKKKAEYLREKFRDSPFQVVEAVVWNLSGVRLKLFVTNNSQSTSVLPLSLHSELYPSIKVTSEIEVTTNTLDDLFPNADFDYVSLDIQGSELAALQGFTKGIQNVKWIYCEVNRKYLYENCSLVDEIDEFLLERNFVRVATRWTSQHWGDALYVHKNLSSDIPFLTRTQWIQRQLRYTARRILSRYKSLLVNLVFDRTKSFTN